VFYLKKLKIATIITCALIIILELLPWGAVLNFINDPSDPIPYIRKTYSYFSLTPFGFANFSPLFCAALSVVLLIIHTICNFVKVKKGVYSAAITVNLIAIVLSITPLMFGLDYYSIVGLMISISLSVLFALTYILHKDS